MSAAAAAAPPPSSVLWSPNPGPQTRFLSSTCGEVLYGGSAGGGKSSALVALPLRWATNKHFRSLILRRETTDLGNLLDQADALFTKAFPGTRSKATGAGRMYRFPSGAESWFNHCQHAKDAAGYDGFEFQLVEFDELTHFEEKQYRTIRARIRSSKPGLPRYTRSTTNPGGEGHEWVLRRWGPWLNPEFEAEGLVPRFTAAGERLPPAAPGEVLWYLPLDSGERWVPRGTPGALSRTFIPALASDNPHLLDNDPEYLQRLGDLDRVRREQLLKGNWLIRDAPGELFQRTWFPIVDAAPAECMRLRVWDRAATEPSPTNPDPDWTAGLRLSLDRQGVYYIEHVQRLRQRPLGVQTAVVNTAAQDGVGVAIGIIRDPAQAGKSDAATYITALAGYNVHAWEERELGDKVARAKPASAQAEAGNVKLVRGPWNAAFLAEAEQFPKGKKDQIDALSMGFMQLTKAAARERWVRRAAPAAEVR